MILRAAAHEDDTVGGVQPGDFDAQEAAPWPWYGAYGLTDTASREAARQMHVRVLDTTDATRAASVARTLRHELHVRARCARRRPPSVETIEDTTFRARVVVGADGRVLAADVFDERLGHSERSDCILRRVRRWNFDPHGDAATVTGLAWVMW